MSKDMTWEELCEKAKEMGCSVYKDKDICMKTPYSIHRETRFLYFYKNGSVKASYTEDDCVSVLLLSENRTPNQMLMIMEALR